MPDGAVADRYVLARPSFGCRVDGGKAGLVSVMGRSRQAVFAEAARILKLTAHHSAPTAISARLYCSARDGEIHSGRDGQPLPGQAHPWSIILGADIAFAPGGTGVEFPAAHGPPQVVTVGRVG